MSYHFTYAGVVEVNQDPMKLGRLKVRVPHIFGSNATSSGYIGVNDLPWALPAGMPAGGSGLSGGFSQLPEPGDKVWVRFLDGEPEKPIWEWGMQTSEEAKTLKLHQYDPGVPVGKPNRALWTRYSHAIELNAGQLIATTSQGYRLVITDASGILDGNIMLTTPKGNSIRLNDLDDTLKITVLEELYCTVGSGVIGTSDSFSWMTMSQDFSIDSGASFNVTTFDGIEMTTAADIYQEALGDMTLGFTHLKLGLAATEPAVLGTQLAILLNALILWMNTHTHTSGAAGSPTSPPLIPASAIAFPPPNMTLSKTVVVQN